MKLMLPGILFHLHKHFIIFFTFYSKFLIIPDVKLDNEESFVKKDLSSEDDDEEDSSNSNSLFKPGQFSCPVVYRKLFPLHWRLKPLHVLRNVMNSLVPLSISNRKNMFVFSSKRSVFYIYLSITEDVDKTNSPEVEKIIINTGAKESKESPKLTHSPASRRSSTPQQSIPFSPIPLKADFYLCMECHGVDLPGREITLDFVSLIDSKINSSLQNILGALLSRNLASKTLTKSDIDFLLPLDRKLPIPPSRKELFKIPDIICSPFFFIFLFRQCMSNCFNYLAAADVNAVLKSYYNLGSEAPGYAIG